MSSETTALVALILYAVVAIAVMTWQFRRSGLDFGVWVFYLIERLYVGLLFHCRMNRRCPFPERGAAIILANHRSPADPMLVWMNNHLGPQKHPPRLISFMMAQEYYEIPGLHCICRTMRCIPVDRDGRDMQQAHQALERLTNGELLGVFPEGRLNTGTALMEGDTGIAWLALHARVPVYPVYIHNSPRSESMVRPFYTPARVRVIYGEPIDLSAYFDRRVTHELLREVTDLMMRRLGRLGGETYANDLAARSRKNVISA